MRVLLLTIRWAFLVVASPLIVVSPWLLRLAFAIRQRKAELPPGTFPRLGEPPRDVSVLIVSFDGKHLLEKCLPALTRALEKDGGQHEIVVADNGSSDGSIEWLRQEWPEVRIASLKRNYGFGEGNNAGLRLCTKSHVLLLNNDMVVEEDFLRPLREAFEDEGVFAVAAQVLQEEGVRREETGRTSATMRNGLLHWSHDPIDDDELEVSPVLWAGGGASLYDRKKLIHLGGFDPVYSPAYVEDADLSWRAWKNGWRSLLAPESKVLHRHRSTSSKVFSKRRLQALVVGNQWLFHMRCLLDRDLARRFTLRFPTLFVQQTLRDGIGVTLPAMARLLARAASSRRARRGLPNRIPDRAILSLDKRYWARASLEADRPRVLVVSAFVPRFGVHAGGQRVYQLLKRLADRWRISVLTFAETEEEESAAVDLDFCEEVRVIRRGRSPDEPNPFRKTPACIATEYANPEMRRAIETMLASGRFDLVQFEWLQMAYLLPEHNSIPAVLTNHEVQSFTMRKRVYGKGGIAWLRAVAGWLQMLRFEIEACRRFQRIVTMTDRDAVELLAYDAELPVVVHNTGVDTQALRPKPEDREAAPGLVFVGYYRHSPNVDAMQWMAEQILPRVREQVPDAQLYIVGASPPPEIEQLGERPGIVVTGRVDSIAPWVHKAHVYVVPLRDGVGIRGKVLEAWALGRAVVSTSVGAAGLRYEHGRHLLVADDVESFAACCVRLLQDETMRARLSNEALRAVQQQYSWDAMAEEYDGFWRDLLVSSGYTRSGRPWRRMTESATEPRAPQRLQTRPEPTVQIPAAERAVTRAPVSTTEPTD